MPFHKCSTCTTVKWRTVARVLLCSANTPCAAEVRCSGASGPSAMCFASTKTAAPSGDSWSVDMETRVSAPASKFGVSGCLVHELTYELTGVQGDTA